MSPRRFNLDVDATSIELTPSTLTLSFQVGHDRLEHWRQLDWTGNVTIKVGFAGAFETIDRAGRDGPTTITPPESQPPFDRGTIALEDRRVRQSSNTGTTVDVAGYPDGVGHEIPRGELFRGYTTGSRQSVTIDAPSGAGFESETSYIQN